jgi:hypothetical protein
MPARVQVTFWSATTASVLLLGVVWTLTHLAHSLSVEDRVLLAVAEGGLSVSLAVAGRIAYVTGRLRRRAGPGKHHDHRWVLGARR